LNNRDWKEGGLSQCTFATFCTVCSITYIPVFTLKGICFNSDIDWNYYLKVGKGYEIQPYEGYKNNDIVFKKSFRRWEVVQKNGLPPPFAKHELFLNISSN
jgi:hypothetical protein